MLTTRRCRMMLCLTLVLGLAAAVMGAAKGPLEKAREEAEAANIDPVVVRMYNVQDLMMGRDHPYNDSLTLVTEMGDYTRRAAAEAGGGQFGDLFGAAPPPGDAVAMTSALTPKALEDILLRTIEGEPWTQEGGRARIERVGALFVITQTEPAQRQIAELLEQFRRARRMVSVEARWLLVTSDLLGRLTAGKAKPGAVPQPVNLEVLKANDPSWSLIYHGRINGLDRQTVYVLSGETTVYTTDCEPVVAQDSVGWDPTQAALLFGVFLEATPALSAERKEAMVNVWSVVSEKGKDNGTTSFESATGQNGVARAQVDKPGFAVHTFRTTARIPLDTPVLVAGLTSPNAADGKVLCLILEVSASPDQPAPAAAAPGK